MNGVHIHNGYLNDVQDIVERRSRIFVNGPMARAERSLDARPGFSRFARSGPEGPGYEV